MSLDSQLRTALRSAAASIDPPAQPALHMILTRRGRRARARRIALVGAACLALVILALAWSLPRALRNADDTVVAVPEDLAGVYTAEIPGNGPQRVEPGLVGSWRLRMSREGTVVLVAPTSAAFGARAWSGSFDQRGGELDTDLLSGGPCSTTGTYSWELTQDGLRLQPEADRCLVRSQVLGATVWRELDNATLPEGTYRTPNLTIQLLRQTAEKAGFGPAEVETYLGSDYPGADSVRYTLQVGAGQWTVYESVDGAPPVTIWDGPYTVADSATVVAGTKPCGPITYDYRLADNSLSMVMLANDCTEPNGSVPVGELIAQTMIYESAPLTRTG